MIKTTRIEYIDALRGFTILLVVLVHIETFSFSEQVFLYTSIFRFFRMPLFFFISGYIVFKSKKVWDTHTFLKESSKKIRIQLIPTLFFGLIFTYLVAKENFSTFITDISKQGYWFTLVLLEMFLVYYSCNHLLYKIKKNNNDKTFIIAMLFSIILLYILKIISFFSPTINQIMNITSLHKLPFYYPYFVFGVLATKYKSSFEKMIDNPYFMSGILILFSLVLSIQHIMEENILSERISAYLLSLTGIIIVFNFFRKYQDSFSQTTQIGKTLQYIGKRTLDIYLLHYFFLPYIPKIHHLFGTSPNLVMELTGFMLAFLVIGCCLLLSNIIRLSDFLGYWLFGVKKKENIKQ